MENEQEARAGFAREGNISSEHVQTSADPYEQVRTWVSVEEAYLTCLERGLSRTKKTIRAWCRKGHIDCQKQITPNGDKWLIDEQSLQVKIDAELEFQAQKTFNNEGSNPSEPVQTSADPYEPVRTRADQSEPVRTKEETTTEQLEALNAKIQSLKIDKAVRDQQIIWLSKQNEEGQNNLLAQSRYIGHLETKVLQLGGEADKSFLEAPQPVSEVVKPEVVHPNQNNLGV